MKRYLEPEQIRWRPGEKKVGDGLPYKSPRKARGTPNRLRIALGHRWRRKEEEKSPMRAGKMVKGIYT
jgi:hypothetical protein